MGLRQGYPLSPILFVLVVLELSQEILEAKHLDFLKGIKIESFVFLTHLLFMDDITLFSNGLERESRKN
jgi:hypothetical protein